MKTSLLSVPENSGEEFNLRMFPLLWTSLRWLGLEPLDTPATDNDKQHAQMEQEDFVDQEDHKYTPIADASNVASYNSLTSAPIPLAESDADFASFWEKDSGSSTRGSKISGLCPKVVRQDFCCGHPKYRTKGTRRWLQNFVFPLIYTLPALWNVFFIYWPWSVSEEAFGITLCSVRNTNCNPTSPYITALMFVIVVIINAVGPYAYYVALKFFRHRYLLGLFYDFVAVRHIHDLGKVQSWVHTATWTIICVWFAAGVSYTVSFVINNTNPWSLGSGGQFVIMATILVRSARAFGCLCIFVLALVIRVMAKLWKYDIDVYLLALEHLQAAPQQDQNSFDDDIPATRLPPHLDASSTFVPPPRPIIAREPTFFGALRRVSTHGRRLQFVSAEDVVRYHIRLRAPMLLILQDLQGFVVALVLGGLANVTSIFYLVGVSLQDDGVFFSAGMIVETLSNVVLFLFPCCIMLYDMASVNDRHGLLLQLVSTAQSLNCQDRDALYHDLERLPIQFTLFGWAFSTSVLLRLFFTILAALIPTIATRLALH